MNGRKMKQFLVVLLTFCTLMTQGGMVAFATEGTDVNSNGVPEGIILNYHEVEPIDSSFAGVNSDTAPSFGTLPTSYSASAYVSMDVEVRENHDAGVRSQSPYGTCWAHSAMAIAESSYIINENVDPTTVDFNEYPLVHYAFGAASDTLNLFGGDYNSGASWTLNLEQGGNNLASLCMFASWHGASDSAQSTYGGTQVENGQTPHSIIGYGDVAHMENGYVLTMPNMSSSNYMADMNVIKQMIMEHGSVAISYYADHSPEYFQASHQYYPEAHETNHSVTVVGWDDSVSASNFTIAPPGDGAWIVKNSWGADWNYGGYFYLSYYDATIGTNAFAFDFASGDNYDNNYQYDGSAYYHGYAGGSWGQVVGANAFVADSNESLEAVGFFTRLVNTDYEISIYRELAEGANPNTGTLVWTQSGSQPYVGYHTVELDAKIPIAKGERYAVVVTLKRDANDAMYFPADTGGDWGWVEFISLAKAGESYVGGSIEELEDLNPNNTTGHYMGENVRIKAFTNERSGNEDVKVTEVKLNHTNYELGKGTTANLEATVLPANATNVKVTWSSSNPNVVTVDQSGIITAVEKGTAVITATAQDGGGASASCAITVTNVLVDALAIVIEGEMVSYYRVDQVGNTQNFIAAYSPADATNTEVTWTSSNPSVATINEKGQLSTVSSGMTFITATAKDGSGVSATCLVAVQTIFVNDIKMTLNGQETNYIEIDEIGKEYDFDVEITPEETEWLGIRWASSNTSVATVDQNGKVKIVGDGDTVITGSITIDGFEYKAECYIVVDATETTFKVQHYVMNVNGTYELAQTETKSKDKEVYTYADFVKAEYNDGQTLSFAYMKEAGYPVSMFYPNEDGTSVVQLYYERQMTPVYIAIKLDDAYANEYALTEAYYVGKVVSIDSDWVKEKAKELFDRTGEIEIYDVIVEQGNVNVSFTNDKYSFTTPANNGMVQITFVTYEKENDVILNGWNQADDGNWYYYKNGTIDTSANGLLAFHDVYWYAVNGKADFTYTGFVENSEGTWYVVNGKADMSINGLIKVNNKWWYITRNRINFDYNGLVKNAGKWWYIKDGTINFTYNGLVKNAGKWWYIKTGTIDFTFVGIVKNAGQYWYISNGQINFTFKGLVKNAGNWWFVQNGKIDLTYDGVATNASGTWYIENGKLDTTKTGIYARGGNYYCFKNGKVNTAVNGIVKNAGQYWYFEKGMINFKFVGIVSNAGSQWYVRSGKIDFTYSGTVKYNGKTYTVVKGKVTAVK